MMMTLSDSKYKYRDDRLWLSSRDREAHLKSEISDDRVILLRYWLFNQAIKWLNIIQWYYLAETTKMKTPRDTAGWAWLRENKWNLKARLILNENVANLAEMTLYLLSPIRPVNLTGVKH